MKYYIYSIALLFIIQTNLELFGKNPFKYLKEVKSKSEYKVLGLKSEYPNLSVYGLSNPGSPSISYTSKALYLNITPSSTAIVNSDIFDDQNWNIKNGFGVHIEAGYFTKFSKVKILGFGIGAGYSSYSMELKSNSLDYQLPDTDVDGDDYTKEIKIPEIMEKTTVSYFDIPVFLELSNMNVNKVGFYGRLGFKVSFPLSKTVTSSGIADYEGYYPQYFVTLYDITELGFTQKEIYQDTKMSLNPVNVSALISAGLSVPISYAFIIKIGVNANIGLMEISSQKVENYDHTKYDGNYSKLLENPNATTSTRSYGVEIGLVYNLSLY